MGTKLRGKGASQWELGRGLSSGKGVSSEDGASQWGESFPVGRELSSWKVASQWEQSFLVGTELRGKEASQWELSSGKGALQ